MQPALVVRLSPVGPWRVGPDSGARDRVDSIYHSDTLFSALTVALEQLGLREQWLDATVRQPLGPAVRFSSCFPFHEETHFVTPPRSLWPPAVSAKLRWKGARFVPLSVVPALAAEQPLDEDRWVVDGPSECVLPASGPPLPGPFRRALRSRAAVDRLSQGVAVHRTACLEFSSGGGFWTVAVFQDEEASDRWLPPVQAAFRLLADSGVGGQRANGWGRFEQPEFIEGVFPDMLFPEPLGLTEPAEGEPRAPHETAFWLLSLFNPGPLDAVDWWRGSYAVVTRGGRIVSPADCGQLKKTVRMVAEGSVLFAPGAPRGAAPDVAPDGFPHPVFRSGFALTVPMQVRMAS